jgi:hypothetical protein
MVFHVSQTDPIQPAWHIPSGAMEGATPAPFPETDMNQHQRKADRINAKLRAQLPLFANQAEVSAADMERLWRRRKAQAAESVSTFKGCRLLGWFAVGRLLALARQNLAAEVYASLHGYCASTYPALPEYWSSFWSGVLSDTKRVCWAWEWREVEGKRRLAEAAAWPPEGWSAPYSAHELRRLLEVLPPGDHPGAVNPFNL